MRNGIEHFVVGGKWQGVEDASVYNWIAGRVAVGSTSSLVRSVKFGLIELWEHRSSLGCTKARGLGSDRGYRVAVVDRARRGVSIWENGGYTPGCFAKSVESVERA